MNHESITLRDGTGRFTGRIPAPRVTVSSKLCSKCLERKDASAFGVDRKNADGLTVWCKPCKAMHERDRKRAAELSRREHPRVAKMSSGRVLLLLDRLACAAREARTFGMWRGRSAIRAYLDLGAALDELHVLSPDREDATSSEAPPCSCPSWPCPRHAEEVQLA